MENFDEKIFLDTLNGRFDNIPKDRSRLVRIFLSSTFSGINKILLKKYTSVKKFKIIFFKTLMLKEII